MKIIMSFYHLSLLKTQATGRSDVLLYLLPLNYGKELNLVTWSVLFFFFLVSCFISIIITDSDPLSHLLIFFFFFAETVLRFQK